MEQASDVEKAMVVAEFLDFKRRNKVCTLFVHVVLNLDLSFNVPTSDGNSFFFRFHFLFHSFFFFSFWIFPK